MRQSSVKVALTGASGFVGRALQKHFECTVFIHRNDSVEEILKKLEGVEVVINLAGAPIVKRWSERYKKVLVQSRITTTSTLVDAINRSGVKHFISTSAIGIYPDNRRCDESCTEVAEDFLGSLTTAWEHEALKCKKPTTVMRFGVVLGRDGGFLRQVLRPFGWGVGGRIGDGKMIMSWIHMDDLVGMYDLIIEKQLIGIFNATSPNPVSNDTLTKTLGKVLRRPTLLPIPLFLLRILYGEAASVMVGSKEIYPSKALEFGYCFRFGTIEKALEDIIAHT